MLQQENVQFMYKNTISLIDSTLTNLKGLLQKKAKIEYKYKEQLEFYDNDLNQKVQKINFQAK
jgi:hypothetical protein